MFIVLKIIAAVAFFLIGIWAPDPDLQVGLLMALLGVVLVGQWQNRSLIKEQCDEEDNENMETDIHSK